MERNIVIPATDLVVSPLGLGTVDAGLKWDGADADRIFDYYLDMGGNLVDSAHVYSDWVKPEVARSERVVGDWLTRSGKRNKIVLITKGGHPDMTCEKPDAHISRMKKSDMVSDLESSLKKLRTDFIDLYFYHRDDETMPVSDLIEAMEDFKKQGKIRYYGCSNWSTARMIEADRYCQEKGYCGFVANQALLNMASKYMNPFTDDTMKVFDADMCKYHAENKGNLAMPYMGVASGFFHIYAAKGIEAVKSSPYCTEANLKIADSIPSLMEKYNASITQIVLGFFTQRNFPCLPLYGPENTAQLDEAMRTFDKTYERADFTF